MHISNLYYVTIYEQVRPIYRVTDLNDQASWYWASWAGDIKSSDDEAYHPEQFRDLIVDRRIENERTKPLL